MSRLEIAVFACCLSVAGAGLVFFPMYYAIRAFRRRRRQSRSFLDVIGNASTVPTASDRIIIEHPPLITVGTGPDFNTSRAAEPGPLGPTAQSSRARAA